MAIETLPHSGAKGNRVGELSVQNIDETRSGAMLCLDLGSKTGWALRQVDGQITSGTVEFKAGRFEGGGMVFLRFKGWLDEVLAFAEPLEAVYFEEVRSHAGTTAAHVYGGFLAHLTAWCEKRKIPYQGIPVGTIKKHATGKGNARKQAVINAMKAKGHHPADDNEADSLAILHLVMDRKVMS